MRESTKPELEDRGTNDTLTEVIRTGARKLIAQALKAEVAELLATYADQQDELGRAVVVRNGHHPARDVQTGIGPVTVRVPRCAVARARPSPFVQPWLLITSYRKARSHLPCDRGNDRVLVKGRYAMKRYHRLSIGAIVLFLMILTFSSLAAAQSVPAGPSIKNSEPDEIAGKKLFYEGFQAIYHYRFSKADSIREILTRDYPTFIWSWFFASNFYWWKIVTGENTTATRQFFNAGLDKTLALLDSQVDSTGPDNEQLYAYITTYAFKARLEVIEKNYLKTIWYMDDCVDYLSESLGKEEEYEFFNLPSGLYNYNMAYALKHYPFLLVASWLYPDSDLKKGLQQLERSAASTDPILSNEGQYFQMRIYFELEKEYGKALGKLLPLIRLFPENLYFRYIHFQILLADKQIGAARAKLSELKEMAGTSDQISDGQKTFFLREGKKELANWRN